MATGTCSLVRADIALGNDGGDVPEARGVLNVMFLTPVLVARGMVARMRAAASACFACSSALDIIRASTDAIAAMPAGSGRRTLPNMSVESEQGREGGLQGLLENVVGFILPSVATWPTDGETTGQPPT